MTTHRVALLALAAAVGVGTTRPLPAQGTVVGGGAWQPFPASLDPAISPGVYWNSELHPLSAEGSEIGHYINGTGLFALFPNGSPHLPGGADWWGNPASTASAMASADLNYSFHATAGTKVYVTNRFREQGASTWDVFGWYEPAPAGGVTLHQLFDVFTPVWQFADETSRDPGAVKWFTVPDDGVFGFYLGNEYNHPPGIPGQTELASLYFSESGRNVREQTVGGGDFVPLNTDFQHFVTFATPSGYFIGAEDVSSMDRADYNDYVVSVSNAPPTDRDDESLSFRTGVSDGPLPPYRASVQASDMGGLLVTALFGDGSVRSASWGDLGGGVWGVDDPGFFRLTMPAADYTIGADWSLVNQSGALGLASLRLNGLPDLTAFDCEWNAAAGSCNRFTGASDEGTPTSAEGSTFHRVEGIRAGDLIVTYSNVVSSPAVGDEFEQLEIGFLDGLAPGDSLVFVADTDVATPEPTSGALLAAGVLAAAAFVRRRSRR